jgi:small-conductance mechanosensitive channel
MRMPKIVAALLLGLIVTRGSAAAQTSPIMAALTPASTAPPAPPKVAPPPLTPAEAQSVLAVLNDPQKRAAFTATLENMVKATAAAKPAAPAALPLAPNSVGAQVITQSATWLSELSGQVSAFRNVLGNLPSVWAFTQRVANNPATRATVVTAAWHLALILIAAALVEWAFYVALKRPTAALARYAPVGTLNPQAEHAAAAQGDDERARTIMRERRFGRMLRLIKRLPFMLARLVLELLPVATFLGLVYATVGLTEPETQAVLWAATTAYVAARLAVVLTRAITSPDHRSLRMVHVSDFGAAYAVRWMRRLAAVAAFGYAAGAIGVQFGMPLPAREAFAKAVMLIDHVFLVIIVLQSRRRVAQKIRGDGPKRGFSAEVRTRLASVWHLVAIFFIVALWLVWAAQVRNGYTRMWHIFFVTAAVLIVARGVAILLLGGLDRLFRVSPEAAHKYPTLEAQANRYYPLLRGTLTTAIFVATFLALLQVWGQNVLAWFHNGALGGKLFSAVITILIAGAVGLIIWEGSNASLERHLERLTRDAQIVRGARLRTLMPILRTILLVSLISIFGLTALSEIGVNIAPLLAGAGIIGVAIGFGSQKLVQDFITGIFLLLENAMQVGDWVTVAGLSGAVENLSIRTMRLRAGDGSVHIIPFSSVSTVTNVNRGQGNAAVSVNVPLEEDTDRVCDVLCGIARDMRGEDRFGDMMRSDLQLWGVDKVDGGVVTIVGQIVCTDSGRWAVQREFNRRLNIRFKEEHIRIATPVQTVLYRNQPTPQAKLGRDDAAPRPEQIEESPPPAALGNTS